MPKVAPKPKQPQDMRKRKYGLLWHPLKSTEGKPVCLQPDWRIELLILRHHAHYITLPNNDIRPWKYHFMEFVRLIWGSEHSTRRFIWNPLAERIIEKAETEKFLGIAGHASSGKSEVMAIWAIAKFLIGASGPNGEMPEPRFVKVFVTSTTLEESRQRIWGVIEAYWGEACRIMGGEEHMPGKLVSSRGKIVCKVGEKFSDLAGIALIPGGKGQDKDASTKIGFKARSVILIADELPLLTHRLYETAKGNLFSNPLFAMVAAGNPTSAFDPFGIFIEPKDGWNSITEDYEEWQTKLGVCIRFDGLKSPNVLAGRDVYPGILTLDKVRAYKETLGELSPEFYRMVRGFLCPTGHVAAIFTEKELIASLSMDRVSTWEEVPTKIAFLDPAFSLGGDRAVASFGKVGMSVDPLTRRRQKVLEKIQSIDLMTRVNAKSPIDINEQIADLYLEECRTRGIPIDYCGVDATGGGTPFATILTMKAGRGIHLIAFGGAPSDMRLSSADKRTGKEKFVNKVSELWYSLKELCKVGQIKGIDPDTATDLCARTYKNVGDKVLVESKADMKKRTNGKSPDWGDSFAGLAAVAKIKCGLTSEARAASKAGAVGASGGDRRTAVVMDASWGQPKRRSIKTDGAPMLSGGGGWGE